MIRPADLWPLLPTIKTRKGVHGFMDHNGLTLRDRAEHRYTTRTLIEQLMPELFEELDRRRRALAAGAPRADPGDFSDLESEVAA